MADSEPTLHQLAKFLFYMAMTTVAMWGGMAVALAALFAQELFGEPWVTTLTIVVVFVVAIAGFVWMRPRVLRWAGLPSGDG